MRQFTLGLLTLTLVTSLSTVTAQSSSGNSTVVSTSSLTSANSSTIISSSVQSTSQSSIVGTGGSASVSSNSTLSSSTSTQSPSPSPSTSGPSSTTSTTAAPGSTSGTTSPAQTTTGPTSTTSYSTIQLTSASTSSVSSIDGTKITTNTHITTTGSDNKATIIPILFGCSFCGGGGIELFGFGTNGAFKWPTDNPDFSGLPTIDVDSDGDPTEESDDNDPTSTQQSTSSPTSSSQCTSSSVTEDLFVTCSVMTASGQTTASTTCETSTSTISGCDLTATATTTTTSTSASATCEFAIQPGDTSYDSQPDSSDPDNSANEGDASYDDDSTKRRSIAGRLIYEPIFEEPPSLLRRGGLSQLGACPLPNGLTINQEPSRPQANQFDRTVAKSDGKWWYQWQNTANTCGVEELWLLQKKQNEKVTIGGQTKKVKEFFSDTVEHVYELKLLPNFFADTFTSSTDSRCQPFMNIFSQTDQGIPNPIPANSPQKAGDSRIQSLFNLLPNNLNMAFVGLEKNINDMKGKLLSPNLQNFRSIKTGTTANDLNWNFKTWNLMGMAIALFEDDTVQKQFTAVQNDIYAAFIAFNDIWNADCTQKPDADWAQLYKDWINQYFKDQQNAVISKANELTSSILQYQATSTTDANGDLNPTGVAFSNLAAKYPPAGMTFPTDSLLTFPQSTGAIKKRTAACTATSTASPTSTGTTSQSTTPSPTQTPTSTHSVYTGTSIVTCSGNQVEGSCVAGALTAQPTNGGIQGPVCNKAVPAASISAGSFGLVRMNADTASSVSSQYCDELAGNKTVVNSAVGPPSRVFEGQGEAGANITLSVSWNVDYCPKNGSMSTVDFTTLSHDQCVQNFFGTISGTCFEDSSFINYNSSVTFEGGMLGIDCGVWAIAGQLQK